MEVIGIDLGTTYSAAAVVTGDGRPEILVNRDGERLTPSVVLFDNPDAVLVGTLARRSATSRPGDCVRFVKRRIGEAAPVHVGADGREYRAEEVSALLLRRLAEDAGAALGRPVRDVVITVPAYFDDARRTATRDAGRLAGLTVHRLVNEPTAAAVGYGLRSGADGHYFVYDLGGGTFDATVLRVVDGDYEVLATDGDRNLGGYDFDNLLIGYLATRIHEQGGPDVTADPVLSAELRERCEAAKHQLSTEEVAPVRLVARGRTYAFQVTRTEFEDLAAGLLYRTELLVESVMDEAQLSWRDIDRVLLVGGCTRMPMVRELMGRLTHRVPEPGVHPDEAVALGAAVIAAALTEQHPAVTVSDVTSQALGTIALDADTGQLTNFVIIPRNSPVPCRYEETFVTVQPRQSRLHASVTEGEDSDPDHVAVLHRSVLDLPPGLPDEAPIRVVMSYDADGVAHVETIDATHGRSLGAVALDRPANLDGDRLAASRAALAHLGVR
ncbi:molecular chaperone DnaK [Longispora fulva]|uniref:Molecular chaperone DnaK n=1 Tax=Longispora fulva TaxID=619741 RepID=A0A8J7GSM8_9ACTN|nr:Hsp70 family protein [Longispora fulva]MBG6137924.1 molecular chaperone DnaK [Longispora fulva]GIG60177.1 molecular chaperone DnaK [Longispora fulva]